MTNEKILLNYRQKKAYTITKLNEIGANTSQTLRTVTTGTALTNKYVRKFGTPLQIKSISGITLSTDRSDVSNKWKYHIESIDDDTIIASYWDHPAVGGYYAGTGLAVACTGVKIVIEIISGSAVPENGDYLTITSDVGTHVVYLSGETAGDGFLWYVSSTGSTYYDEDLMYGGYRHTPDGSIGLPYFKIQDGIDALAGAFVICEVVDSETYDEEITIDGAYTLQASLGQTPTITCGVGARETRTVIHDGNNADTAYVSKAGSDSTGTGTWALPYLTIAYAVTNIGARTSINIKDSESYGIISVGADLIIEPIYGKTPELTGDPLQAYVVSFMNKDVSIAGFIINGANISGNKGVFFTNTDSSVSYIDDCTIKNCATGIYYNASTATSDGNIKRNLVFNCTTGIQVHASTTSGADRFLVEHNICHNNTTGIYQENGVGIFVITNNICFLNTNGIYIDNDSKTFYATVSYNTITLNDIGILFENTGGTITGSITGNIVYGNTTYDLSGSGTSVTITYTDQATYTGFSISTGCISADPRFCDSLNNNFGLSSNSPCYKTDGAERDMGAELRNILISATGVIINGFIIDGQDQYFNAIGKTGATDYAVLTVKWCDIKNFLGIAIDDYSGSATTGTFDNNKIFDNGVGLNIPKGATSISQNLIYTNIVYNVYNNGVLSTFNHNVLFGGAYGFYVATNGIVSVFKNSTTYQNTSYGVYGVASVINVLNSDINDSYNSNVDVSDSSNISVNPLFMSLLDGSEDFNLKCTENGSLYNSSLIEMADDGYDIGAWFVTRAMTGYSWKKYQLAHNGKNVSFEDSMKGLSISVNANGTTSVYGYGEKRVVKIGYPQGQYVTEILRKKIQYFSTLIKTKSNGLTNDEVKFRVHYLPDQFLASGTATIDATAKSIYDSTVQWNENEFRGWHAGVKFTSGTGMVIDATAKTGTKSGAGWTANQWTGYYFYYLGYYYYIASNTTEVLTFLDPDGTLTSGTVAYAVEKYFKITSNTENVLYLSDPDSELEDGSLGYYIDFIEMKIVDPKFSFSQPRFYYQKETWKNGFEITLEEV